MDHQRRGAVLMSGIHQMLLGSAGAGMALPVGFQAANGTSSSPAALGALAGDLAVILRSGGTVTSSGSGHAWTVGDDCTFKELEAADLTAGVTVNVTTFGATDEFCLLIYRGPKSIAKVSSDYSVNPTSTAPGYAKHPRHAGTVVSVEMFDPGGASPGSVSTPATFTQRASYDNGANHRKKFFDRLSPANAYYINGAGIGWTTNWTAVGQTPQLFAFELRA